MKLEQTLHRVRQMYYHFYSHNSPDVKIEIPGRLLTPNFGGSPFRVKSVNPTRNRGLEIMTRPHHTSMKHSKSRQNWGLGGEVFHIRGRSVSRNLSLKNEPAKLLWSTGGVSQGNKREH